MRASMGFRRYWSLALGTELCDTHNKSFLEILIFIEMQEWRTIRPPSIYNDQYACWQKRGHDMTQIGEGFRALL
ncbi:hypothetical protein KSX_38890 [Ktedonospora formicarum]|uniref:Uncharacterized protein n=1 Tax=Ktedonospora formicarum TaxID=2778364 RepID=A0A8J3HYX9_9CHLR|nr:hypothetical protein KSX_38890 [Ktedonospora formicarum]